jgi:glycosyltransferase involved in cell wall biosynthesis
MKILFLYSEIVGYNISLFKELTSNYNSFVHVIHWDKNKIKPYNAEPIDNVFYYNRSSFSNEELYKFAFELAPDIVYVSGWMDRGYLPVSAQFKRNKIPVVVGFDDIWEGSFRQRMGALLFPYFFKKYFSVAWVAGPYQFEFAKKLGFTNDQIIFDLLSADLNVFNKSKADISIKSKSFLYVGNFRLVKGTDILVEAYKIYKTQFGGNWNLTLVGTGNEIKVDNYFDGLKVYPFANSQDLVDYANNSSVFILPSRHDQWGVVVHEFASLGMPLILSDKVGASSTFLIDGFNGFKYIHSSALELAKLMHKFSTMDEAQFNMMSIGSTTLSARINSRTSAANFLSVLNL